MAIGDLRPLAIIAFLLCVSALGSAAELSLLTLGHRRARRVAQGRAAVVLDRMLTNLGSTLGALLVVITAANYTAEAIAANWVITNLGLPVWVAIAFMTVLVLIFAEVTPISYGAANAERVAPALALPVWLLTVLMAVPARVIGFIADGLARLLGAPPTPPAPLTEGELRAIVSLQAETGGLEEEEKVMIHQIFEFGGMVAREVMVPRTDMAAIPETATAAEAARAATDHHVSRLPVYRDSLDSIVGAIHVKDVIPMLAGGQGDAPVAAAVRPAMFVPETKRLSDLLAEFRRERRTLAIVVDEYGGTAGLVTLEDLLEEVVGDIYDEYDIVHPSVERTSDGATILDGRMSIAEASQELGVELPEGEDYDSIAGLLYSRLGVVQSAGEQVDLDGVTLVVEEVDGHRITRVRALPKPRPAEEEATEQ